MNQSSEITTAFISYSWDDEPHKTWVRNLAIRLRSDGVDAILDQWEVVAGDQIPEFMEDAITSNDFVIVVCTPKYKDRCDDRLGGVGFEGDIMTSEVLYEKNNRKFIPVLRNGTWTESAPTWMRGKKYVDLSDFPNSVEGYEELLQTLLGSNEGPPPIGMPPVNIIPAQQASNTLRDFCSDSFDGWEEAITDESPDSPFRFPHGHFEMAFELVGANPISNLNELRQKLANIQARLPAGPELFGDWSPAWPPYAPDNVLESWNGTPVLDAQRMTKRLSPDVCEFWRAAPDGKLYILKGYLEDHERRGQRPVMPGTVFDVNAPILNVATGIIYANRFAEALGSVERIAVRCRFTGLRGRALDDVFSPMPLFSMMHRHDPKICRMNVVPLEKVILVEDIRDGLHRVVHELLQPLYEKFGLYQLTLERVNGTIGSF